VGDVVKSGDILAEVETDKATMELENYEDGTLLYIGAKEGEAVAVDGVIAIIGEAGANYQALLNGGQSAAVVSSQPTAAAEQPQTITPSPIANQSVESDSRVKASPLAKALAQEKGVDLSKITGSGEGGRIVKRDIDAASPQSAVMPTQAVSKSSAPTATVMPTKEASVTTQEGLYEDTPVSQMRKTIARRLSESMFTAPHFYLTMEITMDKAMELRGKLNEVSPVKISFNDFVIKAAALALKQHPAINSSWLGDKIRKYHYVNVGVAVAVDEGLLVPVVRDADKKTLSVIASEVKEFAAKAKDKKLQPKDWEGNTFSISNLGMFGIDEFTAIINPPDACIMAVGGIKQTAAFKADGSVYATNVMKVTLSCDHRVVDGASGAAFLQTFKKLLENPLGMLV
jgi:pyruvate dehydrogenase E2 component (dihydrolipoamide acetyltransferase)